MTKVGAIIAREMEESEARGRAEGRAEGRASALLTLLSSKGEVPGKLEQKIYAQKEYDKLDQWIRIAATAPDVRTFEGLIK